MRNKYALIYTRDNCQWCSKAMDLLSSKLYIIAQCNLDDCLDRDIESFQKNTNGATTVPQIFISGRWIGGHDDLVKYFEDEE